MAGGVFKLFAKPALIRPGETARADTSLTCAQGMVILPDCTCRLEYVRYQLASRENLRYIVPGRLMAGQRPLEPYVEVRILPGQQMPHILPSRMTVPSHATVQRLLRIDPRSNGKVLNIERLKQSEISSVCAMWTDPAPCGAGFFIGSNEVDQWR